MATPKLRLGACLLQSGRCDDYEKSPNIPLITGPPVLKPKESIKDALTGAATAVVKMLQQTDGSKPSSPGTPLRETTNPTYVSPLKSQLRRSCLEDLKRVKELYEDGVFTETKFLDGKRRILGS